MHRWVSKQWIKWPVWRTKSPPTDQLTCRSLPGLCTCQSVYLSGWMWRDGIYPRYTGRSPTHYYDSADTVLELFHSLYYNSSRHHKTHSSIRNDISSLFLENNLSIQTYISTIESLTVDSRIRKIIYLFLIIGWKLSNSSHSKTISTSHLWSQVKMCLHFLSVLAPLAPSIPLVVQQCIVRCT